MHPAERERIASERQRAARANKGIDWTVCIVPGCGAELLAFGGPMYPPFQRNHETNLPICIDHAVVVFNRFKREADVNLPVCVEANVRYLERREARAEAFHEEDKKRHLAKADGHIYFVRLNGLIKVGWSRALTQRLRAYGPDVEVLCHYPATRTDETNLHRQLSPFRAKGREWYQDCKALHDFATEAVEQWGPPSATADWTEPKEVVRPRKRSA